MDTKVNKISFSHRCYQWWRIGKNRGMMFYHSATALHRFSLHVFQFVLHLMVCLHWYWLLFCPHPSQMIAPGPLSRLELWCCSRYNRWWLVRSFQTRSWISTGNNISCEHSPHLASCLLAVMLRILVTGRCTISCWSPWSLNCVVSCNLYFSQ